MAMSHKVPAGIKRVEKGRWSTLDGLHEIRQGDKGWTVERTVDGDGPAVLEGSPFKTRGAAVEALAGRGLLPLEVPAEPQPEPAKVEPVLDPTDASGAEGANGGTGERKRRPRARKPAKGAAATA
jgi:hypothetical protein